MVIFLPSFVLPGVHLIWFSTGLFPLQPWASNTPNAQPISPYMGSTLALLPLPENEGLAFIVPLFQTVLRRFFAPLLAALG